MGIFNLLRRKTKHKAVFLGLDNSGKSTIISFLQSGNFVEHTPTMGKQKKDLEINGTRLSLCDMGGQSHFRKFWMDELQAAKCVVFVVDKSAPERFDEAKAELDKIITAIKQKDIKLLILANKYDLPNSVAIEDLIVKFSLFEVDNFEIVDISAKTGYNMAEAFTKFYSALTGKVIRKKVFTNAVSIYNAGGVPIVMHSSGDINGLILEGGFLSAITSFSQMKIEGANTIQFKSEENGTFIVAKSKHFIGSIFWNDDLLVPVEQTEAALKDLLSHLESTITDFQNDNNIEFQVQQYSTNLMK